jgi:hypothetical protein
MALMTVRLNANNTLGQDLLNVPSSASAPLTLVMHPSVRGFEETLTFVFPYNPISITYNQLSDEVVQVPRPGTTPLVFFKAHRLLSVDITFTLAVPGDGLVQSVDSEIGVLRTMAANSQRVIQVFNYDGMLRAPYPYRNMSAESSVTGSFQDLFFTIVDFSLDSVRRNKLNQITQANCRLSMIENRNPFQNITAIPKLDKPPRNGNCAKWKVCCPKKYKRNCPEGEKVTPEIPWSQRSDAIAARNLSVFGNATRQKEYAKALKELADKYDAGDLSS